MSHPELHSIMREASLDPKAVTPVIVQVSKKVLVKHMVLTGAMGLAPGQDYYSLRAYEHKQAKSTLLIPDAEGILWVLPAHECERIV